MKIQKAELQRILENLRPGLAKRDIVSKLSDFTFLGDRICAFNDQISISHPFESEFECSVDGQNFYSVIVNIPEGNIDLTLAESKLIIKGEKAKASLVTSEGGGVLGKIKVPRIKSKKWKDLPEMFTKGVKLCSFSVSTDLTRPALTCIAVQGDKIFSADNLRISKFLLSTPVGDDFLITGVSAVILAKYPVTQYLKDDSWVHFKTEGDIIFSCRVIVDVFPDVSEYFKVDGVSFALPAELKNVVDSVSVVADEEFVVDQIISVFLSKKDKTIVCSGQGSLGSFERSCSLGVRIQSDVAFNINPSFFSEVLYSGSEMTLGDNHALFTGDSFEHVMCLPCKS